MSVPDFVGDVLSAQAQGAAQAATTANVNNTNDLNRLMFEMSRGGKGNALLPMYFGDKTETRLAIDAIDAYNSSRALAGTPEEQFARYSAFVNSMQPAIMGSNQAVSDVFNGNMTAGELESQKPVAMARSAFAKGQKQSIYDALAQRLDAISADNAKSGFTGSGSFNRNRMLSSTIGANQAASGAMSSANLQNAQDIASIQTLGRNRALQNVGLPFNQVQQNIALSGLPMNAIYANQQNSMQPFNFFKVNPQAFQYAPFPEVQPNYGMANAFRSASNSAGVNLNEAFQMNRMMNNQSSAQNQSNLNAMQNAGMVDYGGYNGYNSSGGWGTSNPNVGGWSDFSTGGSSGGWDAGSGGGGGSWGEGATAYA